MSAPAASPNARWRLAGILLLLVLACALIPVAYASGLQLSSILPAYHGLLLFPGALLAFGLGWLANS